MHLHSRAVLWRDMYTRSRALRAASALLREFQQCRLGGVFRGIRGIAKLRWIGRIRKLRSIRQLTEFSKFAKFQQLQDFFEQFKCRAASGM